MCGDIVKFRLVEDVNIETLNELLSESDFKEPIRVKINISSQNNIDKNQLHNITNNVIKSIKLSPEILVDESDGSYQLCFPGRKDWIKSLSDVIQSKLQGKVNIEIL